MQNLIIQTNNDYLKLKNSFDKVHLLFVHSSYEINDEYWYLSDLIKNDQIKNCYIECFKWSYLYIYIYIYIIYIYIYIYIRDIYGSHTLASHPFSHSLHLLQILPNKWHWKYVYIYIYMQRCIQLYAQIYLCM